MLEFLKMNIGKSDKKEVDVTVCYYHLDENKDRYVFYFYDPTEKSPIYKWAYYLIDENYKDLRKHFNEVLKEKNYKPNKYARLCMCNRTTKINTLKLPKTLKYSMNYKSIINDDLKEKMGSDVKSKYFIDNKIEGLEEKKAEQVEKRVLTEARRRQHRVDRYKAKIAHDEFEYKYERDLQKLPLGSRLVRLCIGLGLFVVGVILATVLLSKLNLFKQYTLIPCIVISVLYALLVGFTIVYNFRKKRLVEDLPERKRITYKNLMDGYYALSTAILLYGSEVFAYFLYLDKIPEIFRNLYGIFAFLYILSILICERIKRKNLSKLDMPVERKTREKKVKVYHVEQDEDDEELFEDSMNENKLFNMSKTKVKIKKSKKARSIITYRQLLVPKDAYKSASRTLSCLHLQIKSLRTLPSLIASFHRRYSRGVNEIVAYNEAGFTLLVGFVNEQIVDCMFIEGKEKAKVGEGTSVGLHLSSFRNVFSSLLWACQSETNAMDRVVYISNTPKNIDSFKKENLFGLPYEVVPTTDIIFGESARKVKSMALLKAFTIVETAVAIFVFSVTASMVATLALGINRFNRNLNDSAKANAYVNNICQVLNAADNHDMNETIHNITQYYYKSETDSDVQVFTLSNKSYKINGNFEVFKPSLNVALMTYQVYFDLSVTPFPKEGSTVQQYTKYTFTIKRIHRIGEQRNIVSNAKIEVFK